MTRLGLRLAVAGGSQTVLRLAVTVVGASAGVAVLLVALGLEPAILARAERLAQRGASSGSPVGSSEVEDRDVIPPPGLLVSHTVHHLDHVTITVVDAAEVGRSAPTPPGLVNPPSPGEAVASPAFHRLLTQDHSAAMLTDGFRMGAQLGSAALADPEEVVIWRGWTPERLLGSADRLTLVTSYPLSRPAQQWWSSELGRRVGVVTGGAVLLVPLLVFIAVMTRLGARQRDARLAALRLVGATRRQCNVLAGVEAGAAGVASVAIGSVLFLLVRPVAARLQIAGHAWFPSDLTPPPFAFGLVAVGLPLLAALSATAAMGRVDTSALGVVRRSSQQSVAAWRVVLPVVGLVAASAVAFFADALAPEVVAATAAAAIVAVLIGIPTAGPWAVGRFAGVIAARTHRGEVLMATRRIEDDPRSAFRATTGIVIAVFAATLVHGYVGANLGTAADLAMPPTIDGVVDTVGANPRQVALLLDTLRIAKEVEHVTAVRRAETTEGEPVAVVDCSELEVLGIVQLEPCPADAWWVPGLASAAPEVIRASGQTEEFHLEAAEATGTVVSRSASSLVPLGSDLVIAAEKVPRAFSDRLTIATVVVSTHRQDSLASLQSRVATSLPGRALTTRATLDADLNRALYEARRGVDIVVAIVYLIGGVSLAATLLGRLLESRQALTALRMSGWTQRQLRHAVMTEALLPMAVTLPAACLAGMLSAASLTHAVGGGFRPPLAVGAILCASAVLAAVALVAAGFPLLAKMTAPQTLRTE